MASKSDFSAGLEITKLSTKVASLEAKLKALQEGRVIPDNLPEKASNLRQSLLALKLKMQRDPSADDNLRKLALETELGRVLLQIDGVL